MTGELEAAFALCSLSLPKDAGAPSQAHFRNLPRLCKDWQCSALAKSGVVDVTLAALFPKTEACQPHAGVEGVGGSPLSDVQLECCCPGEL